MLESRRDLKSGPMRIAAATGVPARIVSRILARHHVPRLAWCDPLTGQLIRASRATANRYERDLPRELVHIDVKMRHQTRGASMCCHRKSFDLRFLTTVTIRAAAASAAGIRRLGPARISSPATQMHEITANHQPSDHALSRRRAATIPSA